ncbi:hypothetical protein DFP72DRAFT_1075103 [Ephemerocybe angulata]|uniref:MYND-type domain-containing protein n=1 Tax=Ephemerocybe angulata TaxID=980116 RepID=A0A8H6HJS8_9AGAR|nr:hypothetical protein DFP72DRAFT_1075103 [Tulosesus angulatus]
MPPRRPQRVSGISPQILADASNGCVESLGKIINEVERSFSNCTLDVARIVFKNLAHEVPSYGNLDLPRILAINSLQLLEPITRHLPAEAAQRTVVLDELVKLVDNICLWTNDILDNSDMVDEPHPEERCTSYLAYMSGADPQLETALYASSLFCGLLIRLWLFGIPDGAEAHHWSTPDEFNLLSLMWSCVIDDDGRAMVVSQLSNNSTKAKDFVMATLSRVYRAREACLGADKAEQRLIISCVHALVHVTTKLTSSSTTLDSMFRKSGYLRVFSMASASISALIGPEDDRGNRESIRDIADIASTLGVAASSLIFKVNQRYCELFSGDYLQLLECVTKRGLDAEQGADTIVAVESISHALRLLGDVVIHPILLSALEDIEPKLRGPFRFARLPAVSLQVLCDSLNEKVQIGIDALFYNSRKDEVYVCSSLKCDRSPETLMSASNECSRCFSVLYCSKECQAHDWKEFHHSECKKLKESRFLRKANGEPYPYSTRAFHLAYIESYVSKHPEVLDELSRAPPADTPPHRAIPILDFTSGDMESELDDEDTHPLTPYLTTNSRMKRMMDECQGSDTNRMNQVLHHVVDYDVECDDSD